MSADALVLVGVVVLWFALNLFILPAVGVPT
jgi:hypothetical protein